MRALQLNGRRTDLVVQRKAANREANSVCFALSSCHFLILFFIDYYVRTQRMKEFDFAHRDYDDDQLLLSTQPPQNEDATLGDEPDGWAECLLTGFTKRAILETPGFPRPILRRKTILHEIRPTPSAGLGIFSTQNLEMGDLVFAERPMLLIASTWRVKIGTETEFTPDMLRRAELQEREKVLRMCFERMPTENQEEFMLLHNSHRYDGSGPLGGIVRTNSFGLKLRNREGVPSAAVFKEGSRFNHRYVLGFFVSRR